MPFSQIQSPKWQKLENKKFKVLIPKMTKIGKLSPDTFNTVVGG